ncbi:uncharacterized protein LOC125716624 [Brienomyrus brachyistius]|uniref:uncharacterized protein LOC125716624 n=1 Tax=Brienomyrus brachyistius TaxID=42636 RepID=UPI0020B2287A|nr:uncharacterized protein LOC125716624 [Brienomyrus brachyistius]
MMEGFPVRTCYEAEDASDEDQEDLPYDGDLGTTDTGRAANTGNCSLSDNSPRVPHFEGEFIALASHTNSLLKDQYTVDGSASRMVSGKINEIRSSYTRDTDVIGHAAMDQQNSKSCIEAMEYKSDQDTGTVARTHDREPPSDVTDLLLRHLPQEELFNSSKYIEAETMPEVSFIDSVEETVLTKLPCSPRHSEDHSSAMENSLRVHRDGPLNRACKPPVLESVELEELEDSQTSKQISGSDESVALEEQSELCCRSSNSELTDEHEEIPRLSGFRSCSELKYGQGQVHYPLPDFSKVAPKVKIPRSVNPAKSDSKFPSDPRFQASPSTLRKSSGTTTVVISEVLEDSVQPSAGLPHEFDNQLKHGGHHKTSELVQHLQAEYDKLLTRYAEAENLIDQLRLGTTAPASSDPTFPPEYMVLPEMEIAGKATNHTDSKQIHPLPTGHPQHLDDLKKLDSHMTATDKQPSEGERMTNELKEIISRFMIKVEEFKMCLDSLPTGISEQQMIFKGLVQAQDQLERHYIAKKEEHRALQMQNYMGVVINAGEFDPERQVEGEIFRTGMFLEDIKELIDNNICSQFSPPTLSSSPAQLLHDGTTSLSPAVLQAGQNPRLSTSSPVVMDTVGGADVETCSSPTLPASDSVLQSHQYLGSSDASPEQHESPTCKVEERLSKGLFQSGSLHLSPTTVPQGKRRKPESQQNSLKTRDPLSSDCMEDAPTFLHLKAGGFSHKPRSSLQSTATPETDSGIGGLGTNCPAVELFHSSPWTENAGGSRFTQALHSEHISEGHAAPCAMTDSDGKGSWSNAQRAKDPTAQPKQPGQTSASTVGRWTCSIARENSALLTAEWTADSPHAHALEAHAGNLPKVCRRSRDRTTAETLSHTCSCHRDLILALQTEVGSLKRDLEQSLLCLPYIAKRMDYLASRFTQDTGRKRKPRAHHRTTSTGHEALMKTSTNPLLEENGSSTDMDPRRTGWSSTLAKERHYSFSTHSATQPIDPPFDKNWRSSCSLPASFADIEQLPKAGWRLPGSQSDSALLPHHPSFLKSGRSPHSTCRVRSHHKYKREEENISRTLDRAIEAAWTMKLTTDQMALRLSADLAKADLYRKLHGFSP